MSKHTEGPWTVSRKSSAYMQGTIVTCKNNTIEVAGVWDNEDARLIAAAPELLEALEAIQANPNDPRAHRQALDAIKKARGQ